MKKVIGTVDKEDMHAYVNNFVLTVFATADKEERTIPTITKKQAIDFKRCQDFI